ncbi:hypothetical protein Q7P37_010325 [Cladosporium fusiforme]
MEAINETVPPTYNPVHCSLRQRILDPQRSIAEFLRNIDIHGPLHVLQNIGKHVAPGTIDTPSKNTHKLEIEAIYLTNYDNHPGDAVSVHVGGEVLSLRILLSSHLGRVLFKETCDAGKSDMCGEFSLESIQMTVEYWPGRIEQYEPACRVAGSTCTITWNVKSPTYDITSLQNTWSGTTALLYAQAPAFIERSKDSEEQATINAVPESSHGSLQRSRTRGQPTTSRESHSDDQNQLYELLLGPSGELGSIFKPVEVCFKPLIEGSPYKVVGGWLEGRGLVPVSSRKLPPGRPDVHTLKSLNDHRIGGDSGCSRRKNLPGFVARLYRKV